MKKGSCVFKQNDKSDDKLYVILYGRVSIMIKPQEKEE
jgi:hypothetical protein